VVTERNPKDGGLQYTFGEGTSSTQSCTNLLVLSKKEGTVQLSMRDNAWGGEQWNSDKSARVL